MAADYANVGFSGPYHASIWKPRTVERWWVSLVDGFGPQDLTSRFDVTSYGRLAFFYNSFCNWFGLLCRVTGQPLVTLDTPSLGSREPFANFLSLQNNPLRAGLTTMHLGLAKPGRVEVKLYDVTGRLVRVLADRPFAAGEHTLTWDGSDERGRRLPRGVYFARFTCRASGFQATNKVIFLEGQEP